MKSMLKTKKQGLLIVLSGPSGCGKNSVIKQLLTIRPNCWISISCTSRQPRPGEENGKDYYFLSKEEFEKDEQGIEKIEEKSEKNKTF